MKCTAIVLAAGKGSRMGSGTHKQFMALEGYPLVYYSLRTFEKSVVDEVILVTGKEEVDYCKTEIVDRYGFRKIKKIVAGGSERYLSVYEGLCAVDEADIVLVHDGARPFVTAEVIERAIHSAVRYGSGIAAMPSKDTVKIANTEQFVVETPRRDNVWIVQTPQAFQYPLIRMAYDQLIKQHIQDVTDDAMVMERILNKRVKLVEANYWNIKITTPEDMEIAVALLKMLT